MKRKIAVNLIAFNFSYEYLRMDGSTAIVKRQDLVQRFNEVNKYFFMIKFLGSKHICLFVNHTSWGIGFKFNWS